MKYSLSFCLVKSKVFCFLTVYFFFSPIVFAQTFTTKQLLDAWKVEGVQQTISSELAYADLTENFNLPVFEKRVKELDQYLEKGKDLRLAARVMLYRMQGRPQDVSVSEFWQCILNAGELEDEQLLSEMYAKYGEIKASQAEKLYYLLKAIEIQERIGIQYFHHIYFRYLAIGGMLYRIDDFERSLQYALKGLAAFDQKKNYFLDYIFLIDLTGACYKNLGDADNAFKQYDKLERLLDAYKRNPEAYSVKRPSPEILNIWRGITDGGKARALVLKKRYDEALPLLKSNIDSSLRYQEFGNAASALNVAANIKYNQHKLSEALALFQQAHNYGFKANQYYHLKAKLETADGLTRTFSKLGNTDSAYVYLKEFNFLKDSVQNSVRQVHFSVTNAELEFELMQKQFSKAKSELNKQKMLRNIILVAIVVLALFIALAYKSKRLKHRVQQEKLNKEKELAQQEAVHASAQLEDFKRNITEKNKLIEDLKVRYESLPEASSLLVEDISILTDDEWNNFKSTFVRVYPNFFADVKKLMPDISASEIRFLTLSKLNISTKEMAVAQGITQFAVRKQRYRLRKKLDHASPGLTLEEFLDRS